MISFSQVTKLYKTVIGVNDISLDVEPGAYALLGPNGSGKTTFINLITGQLRPTLGAVRVFGENPWQHDDLLRQLGVCPAVDVLLPTLSAFDWVAYLLKLQGFSGREARRRAEVALERVGMTHAMRRPIGTYSLGMRQRSKIAQAIAHEPRLLILDEPFNGLDPIGRHEMTKLLEEWVAEGRCFLLASHLLHEVEALQPAFLLISGGRLLASGTPEEVRELMVELPREIELLCDQPRQLAPHLCELPEVTRVELKADQGLLQVATKNLSSFSEALPRLIREQQVQVSEVRSGDGALHELFAGLLKIHRGEA